MPLKVCFVLLRAYAVFRPELKERFGGAEVQFYMFSRELAKDPDFEVACVGKDFGQPDGETIDGVRHFKIPQGWKPLRRFQPIRYALSAIGLYRTLRRIDADIYVQFCAAVETGIVALYCKRHGKKPIYLIASDFDVDGRFEKENPPWVRIPFTYGLRHIDRIVCQNEYQQRHLRERFGKEGPIMPSLCEVPDKYAPPRGRSILWVSRLVAMKRPEIFFDLARAFPAEKFVMVVNQGPDPDYFRKTVSEGKKIANLEILQSVPYQDMDRYFADARVFVNTSTFEGFPNTFLQAMKYGVPLLSLEVNPNEVLTKGNAGLAADGDAERLKEGLARLLEGGPDYASRSESAYAYAVKHHDLCKITVQYKAIFREMATA